MAYRFATKKEDYSDFASGRVFHSSPGQPAFPVRLVSEIFQRSLALLGKTEPVSLYDPCCGSAYHLAVLGVLHRNQLGSIIASDIDPDAVKLATRNLALLTPSGLAERRQAIAADWQKFGKASHQAAIGSVDRIAEKVANAPLLPTRCYVADATKSGAISAAMFQSVDLVISDLPYGQLSAWQGAARHNEPIWHLLDQLQQVLHGPGVVALATPKGTTVAHENYERCVRFRHGKRMITFLKRVPY
jgi:23S rRNA G2445 N2-methylase RlmL